MCGIAGALRLDGGAPDPRLLDRMTDTLAHRGPDGRGVTINGPCGLGHRRLAILDLSEAGAQPMSLGTLSLTYNGEIYNYREIREELTGKGCVFHSNTDTEVILHAYQTWGKDCLPRFNGMFAFALWDTAAGELWLVRDRLGVKPLFYAHMPSTFLFGSEMQAVLASGGVPRILDHEALACFLSLNYTPAPRTLLKNVRQLPPGQWLTINTKGDIHLHTWWDYTFHEGEERSESAWLEEFSALLSDSVRLRMISDVPLGVFLSGGLDSSAVAWHMSRQATQPVNTFTAAFGDPEYDETPYARHVAGLIGARHTEERLEAQAAALLPQLVRHAGEPTADSSMLAVWQLSRLTRQHVTVALSGDGADELLAGYETYQAQSWLSRFQRLPAVIRTRLIPALVRAIPPSLGKVAWDEKLRRFLAGSSLSPERAHGSWRMVAGPELRRRLLAPVWHDSAAHFNFLDLYDAQFQAARAAGAGDFLNQMLYVDTRFYLPNDMLVKLDRMSMAHSLEAREPMLDHRLVSFTGRLPPGLKLRTGREKKYLLKRHLEGKLPPALIRRKKAGFNIPAARWLRGELKDFAHAHLSGRALECIPFLDKSAVTQVLHAHFQGREDNGYLLWGLLTLSLWSQIFLSSPSEKI